MSKHANTKSVGASKNIELALIGNPNSGKSTLFNQLTGSRQSTGNWPGVTVDKKEGTFTLDDKNFHIVDLPGTYSLDRSDTSADERIARDFVHRHPNRLYINLVDASTLQRGLYLSTQLREQGVPTIIVLNMMDVADKRGIKFDLHALEKEMKCPVIAISLLKDKKNSTLNEAIINYDYSSVDAVDVQYTDVVNAAIKSLSESEDISRVAALELLQTPSTGDNVEFIDTYRTTIENVAEEE